MASLTVEFDAKKENRDALSLDPDITHVGLNGVNGDDSHQIIKHHVGEHDIGVDHKPGGRATPSAISNSHPLACLLHSSCKVDHKRPPRVSEHEPVTVAKGWDSVPELFFWGSVKAAPPSPSHHMVAVASGKDGGLWAAKRAAVHPA